MEDFITIELGPGKPSSGKILRDGNEYLEFEVLKGTVSLTLNTMRGSHTEAYQKHGRSNGQKEIENCVSFEFSAVISSSVKYRVSRKP